MTLKTFNSICVEHGVKWQDAFKNQRVRDHIGRSFTPDGERVEDQLELNRIITQEFNP
jgi:hypothetical protein